jgi:hypothetical protein
MNRSESGGTFQVIEDKDRQSLNALEKSIVREQAVTTGRQGRGHLERVREGQVAARTQVSRLARCIGIYRLEMDALPVHDQIDEILLNADLPEAVR